MLTIGDMPKGAVNTASRHTEIGSRMHTNSSCTKLCMCAFRWLVPSGVNRRPGLACLALGQHAQGSHWQGGSFLVQGQRSSHWPGGGASSSKGSVALQPKLVGHKGVKRELEPTPPWHPPPPAAYQGGGRLLPPATAAVTRAWSAAMDEFDEQDRRLGAVQLVSSQNMHS